MLRDGRFPPPKDALAEEKNLKKRKKRVESERKKVLRHCTCLLKVWRAEAHVLFVASRASASALSNPLEIDDNNCGTTKEEEEEAKSTRTFSGSTRRWYLKSTCASCAFLLDQ